MAFTYWPFPPSYTCTSPSSPLSVTHLAALRRCSSRGDEWAPPPRATGLESSCPVLQMRLEHSLYLLSHWFNHVLWCVLVISMAISCDCWSECFFFLLLVDRLLISGVKVGGFVVFWFWIGFLFLFLGRFVSLTIFWKFDCLVLIFFLFIVRLGLDYLVYIQVLLWFDE